MISVSKGIGTYVPENWRRGRGVAHVSCQWGGRPLNGGRNILNGEGRVDTMEDTMNYLIVNNHSITTKMNS